MAPHSSTLAWKIPWAEEPGRLQSMGSWRVGHDWATFHFHALEKEMATHSSVLAWRISGTAEPGGLPSMGSHRVRHDWSDLAAAAAASFMVQLSHPYMNTGKTIALTRWTFVGKVMSQIFNTLSRLVITFLPRSKHLLIKSFVFQCKRSSWKNTMRLWFQNGQLPIGGVTWWTLGNIWSGISLTTDRR